MKQTKKKLTAQEIINMFKLKPIFDKSEKDTSLKYGWPSTRDGMYSITDVYNYFGEKGFSHKDVDDCIYTYINVQDAFTPLNKLDKKKIDSLFIFNIINYNPDYKNNAFVYYLYDLNKEEAYKIKREYEAESYLLMKDLMVKKEVKTVSASKKKRNTKINKSKKLTKA